MKIAWPIYRRLAEAFPHEFKLAFGDEMMQAGEDCIAEVAKRHGIAGVVRLIADLALRLPLEYLSEMGRDLKYAARTLAKSPGYALVGIASMGLGIGLTTNVYTEAWVLLTRTLSGVANPNQLVTGETPASYPYIERFRDQKNLFTGVAAVQKNVQFNVALPGQSGKPEPRLRATRLARLLLRPRHGGAARPSAQRRPGQNRQPCSRRHQRSLLAQPLQRRPGTPSARPSASTDRTRPSSASHRAKFDGALTANPAELFVPITVPATVAPELGNDAPHNPSLKSFQFLMRLAPGVSIDSAESALDGITRRLDKDDPLAPPSGRQSETRCPDGRGHARAGPPRSSP